MNDNDNLLLLSDSYKYTHASQYPPGTEYVYSYLESRGGRYPKTLFFGLQYIIKKYLTGSVVDDKKIDEAEEIINMHMGRPLFNRAGWEYIVDEYEGRLPVRIKAVPEGMTVPTHNVLMTVCNTDPLCFWLTNWLETLLLQVWYSITVATQSREIRKIMDVYAGNNGDPSGVPFKLHDFGFRGVSSVESAGIGGAAHAVSFQGSDTVAAITMLRKYYGAKMPLYSIPACYDEITEILTNKGFKLFKDLNSNDLVAQYHDNGSISFVIPSNVIESMYNGDMVEFSTMGKVAKVDLLVTPNHRMISRCKKTNQIEVQTAKSAIFNTSNTWIQAATNTDVTLSNSLSMIDKLRIAFQADGSYASHAEDYNGYRTGCVPIRFSLKKERKCNRLRYILKELNFKYSEHRCNTGNKQNYTDFWISIPIEYKMSKIFDWVDIQNVSATWCDEFVTECSLWDGSNPTATVAKYDTTNKYNADIVQIIGVLAGRRSSMSIYTDKRGDRKPLYTVLSCKANGRMGKNIVKKTIPYNGTVHCVTVPSGMIVVRRNNIVSISGNSEHSTITAWGRDHEVDAMRNMLKQYPDGVVACVSDSFNIFEACENIWGGVLKDEVMGRNGTLTCRLDSGEPISIVMSCLDILDKKFGHTINEKGYKVLDSHMRIIQGDGVDQDVVQAILWAMDSEMWSIDNIAFGMGGALLQKLNRDTQKFAFKCSAVRRSGNWMDVMKDPITDKGKRSKTGRMKLVKVGDVFRTVKKDELGEDILEEVFLNGTLLRDQTIDEIRELARK